ncbi:MAG: NAD(P)-dependent oxidoreductase [Paracoccaceae bacterium]
MTGAGGKLGRLLRAAWVERPVAGLRPIWAGRGEGHDIQWDMLSGSVPELPPSATVLHLAGVVRGSEGQLAENSAMLPALVQASRAVRRVLFVSTAAVYRPGPLADEGDAPAPPNPYGRAKLLAEEALRAQGLCPVTVLRLGNVAGADALLGPRGADQIVLDPVPGRAGGPVRSWIGPKTLAHVLGALTMAADLPDVVNVACTPPLPMADLLEAAGLPWRYGPETPAVTAEASLSIRRLASLVALPQADAATLTDEAAWARGILA